MIKIYQNKYKVEAKSKQTEQQLNLTKNENGIYECHGRIIGDYPIFIPTGRKACWEGSLFDIAWGSDINNGKYSSKILDTTFKKLTKTVIHQCNSCNKFEAFIYFGPVPGQLPTDRTNGYWAFPAVGLDYAGPIFYKGKTKTWSLHSTYHM